MDLLLRNHLGGHIKKLHTVKISWPHNQVQPVVQKISSDVISLVTLWESPMTLQDRLVVTVRSHSCNRRNRAQETPTQLYFLKVIFDFLCGNDAVYKKREKRKRIKGPSAPPLKAETFFFYICDTIWKFPPQTRIPDQSEHKKGKKIKLMCPFSTFPNPLDATSGTLQELFRLKSHQNTKTWSGTNSQMPTRCWTSRQDHHTIQSRKYLDILLRSVL